MSIAAPLPQARRIDMILNGGSGSVKEAGGAEKIAGLLQEGSASVNVRLLEEGQDLRELASKACNGDADVIVAAGGDGTISAVAGELAGTGKTLGVLPLGTFNFFSRRVGIPLELPAAVDAILHGTTTQVDVGEVNGRLFLNKASVGLYPIAIRHRERMYRKFGRNKLVGIVSSMQTLLNPGHVMRVRLETEEESRGARTRFLFVCTNPQELERLNIRGGQCLREGKFAVYFPKALGRLGMLKLAIQSVFRKLKDAEGYEALCARELVLDSRRPTLPISVDGEALKMSTPLKFRLRQGDLRVAVPAAAPEK